MPGPPRASLIAGVLLGSSVLLPAADDYTLGPDSQPQPGVPKGRIEGPLTWKSTILDGTTREYCIRQSAPRPLRVFLQDGTSDLDNRWGNWPLANQQMAAALRYRGYDYRFELGDGGHTHEHGGALLPDTLRWLWRDYPK